MTDESGTEGMWDPSPARVLHGSLSLDNQVFVEFFLGDMSLGNGGILFTLYSECHPRLVIPPSPSELTQQPSPHTRVPRPVPEFQGCTGRGRGCTGVRQQALSTNAAKPLHHTTPVSRDLGLLEGRVLPGLHSALESPLKQSPSLAVPQRGDRL